MDLPSAFGKYELLERIATGGMAEVFLARSFGVAGFEKRLVIKRIRSEFAQDPRFVSMFINEAKISVHLNHPNVVQVYDLGKVGTTWYIAMEHLHGRDLNKVVKALRAAGERLPLAVAVAVVAEVCRGLAYAHERTDGAGTLLGLVHRDVSPHNVIVTFTGDVKLVDFGIARLMNTEQGNNGSGVGGGRPGGGKYAYMSPEQTRGEEVDHRTDIFSAGIVLWELIVGHRLFDDPDPLKKLHKVQQAVIPDPRDEGAAIDDDLWAILLRALAVDRADRYSSAAVFEEDLRAWLFHHGERAGRTEIAGEIRRAFPTEAETAPELVLHRMVEDVEQLDAPTLGTVPTGGSLTPAVTLGGRLAPSEGERKNVVVLLVDIDGLTALSARVEPEVLFKYHYQILRWLRRIVDRYGGIVQRAIDDQILLLFGAPRTRADDVARALECALELQRRVPEIRGKGFHIELAIGVHSGEVTLGPNRRQVRYEARGNTTRLARRLSAVADHGQVLVSERVLRGAGGEFRLKRGPDIAKRGGKLADASYFLEGRRRGSRVAGKGPWLRRGNELDVIRDALVELASGRGSAIALLGAEGTGKSRLVREIRDLAQRRGLPMYAGRCIPYREDGADPFADLVREVVGIESEVSRAEVHTHLDRLAQLGLSRRDIEAIAGLLGIREHTPDPDEIWQALGRMIAGLSRDGAVLIALEELHHLGGRHLGRLRRLVALVADKPVLLLLTHRGALPSELAGIGQEVELGPFSRASQHRLLKSLLEVDEIDPEIAGIVERSCEGNPLYIEEMVKFLLDSRRIRTEDRWARLADSTETPTAQARELAIPDSVAGLIAARIDQLDPAAKGALRLAAVIGMTFSGSLLGEAAGIDDPTPLITDLVGHGLVARSSSAGGDTWAFASELVREVTLRGILGVQRRDYHRLVAAAIESLYAEQKDDWAEILAGHCAAGGRPLDAARYAFKAGQALENASALDRARDTYEQGLRCIREVPERTDTWDARIQGEAMLSLRYGIVNMLLGDTRRAEKSLNLALDITSEAGVPWVEARAHLELGRSYLHRGKTSLANAHIAQARELSALESDPELAFEALEAAAMLAYEEGRHADAESLWNEALRSAEDNPAAAARCLIGLANRHLRAGELDKAAALLDQALEAARRARNRILEGRVLNNVGLLHSGAGRFDEALSYFRKALQVREGIGYSRGVVVNHHNIGDVHFARRDWARAHVAFERSRELAAEVGWERGVVLNEIYLGYIDALRGDRDGGLARTRRGAEDAARLGDLETSINGRFLHARFRIEHGETEQGRVELRAALDDARSHDLKHLARSIEGMLDVTPA